MTGIAERPMTARTSTPHKQALTSRQRTSLRSHLAGDREQTRLVIDRTVGEVDAFVSARNDAPTDDENDPEGPTLAFERSQASAMLRQSEQHLRDIDAALLRMDEGTYGLCTKCGGEIAIGRLQVRPQASLCIRCAEHVR
jgi:RNA polymerase-binding protein DksA